MGATMRNDAHIILGVRSHVVCVEAARGNELWRTKLKGSQFVTVFQRDDRIFASAAGELFCLRASSGNILWHNKLSRLGYGIVSFGADAGKSVRDDLIIAIKGTVLSINPLTGHETWRSKSLGPAGQAVTLLTLGSRHIIAGHHGEVHCLDRTSGRLIWTNSLKGLGYGLVTLGGSDAAIAQAILQAQAAGAAAATSAAH